MSKSATSEAPATQHPLTPAGDSALVAGDISLGVLPPEATPAHPHANPDAGTGETAQPLWRRLFRSIGIDRAVGFTVLARGWASLAGIGTISLIARFLTPAEQGFYYVFYSLVAMQIIFELGFSVVILQTASHESAHLVIDAEGRITGPARAHARLASVLQKAVRWYSVAAVLMAVTLVPVGLTFFHRVAAKPGAEGVHYMLPWIMVVVASSCTFQIDPMFSFLEGCGYVPQVAQARLRQSLVSTALGWTAFLLHLGLFAPAFFIFGQALAGSHLLYRKRGLLLSLFRHACEDFRIQWMGEVWPFQWRIAVSWLCGYLASQLFSPILMTYRGPVEAGQMGMSLTVCATLSTLAVSWMATKSAPFGQMISRREYGALDSIFSRTLVQSCGAALLACIAVWGAVEWLTVAQVRVHHVLLASRLLPPLPLGMLFLGTIINVVVVAEAIYLRAHKQEKFMLPSIVSAVYAVAVAFFIGRMPTAHGGAWGITAGFLLGSVVIGLGYGSFTFFRWRRIWHAPQETLPLAGPHTVSEAR